MAKFQATLPDEVLKDFKKIERNTDKILGEMTEAGAKVVMSNVKSGVPISSLSSHVKLSKTYKTPSDGGINTKVYFGGYLPFSTPNRKYFARKGGSGKETYYTDKGVPASFIAQTYEYGTSNRYTNSGSSRGKISKKPFFRKSFRKSQIEQAMLQAQKKASGGLLE